MTINELVREAHALAISKGWYEGERRNVPEILCLIHSEISEALEEYRRPNCSIDMIERVTMTSKPEGFPVELADAVIRIADLCGYLGIDLEGAIKEKHEFNKTREHRHGGKRA